MKPNFPQSYHHTGAKKHRTAVYIFVVTEEHADFPEARLGEQCDYKIKEALPKYYCKVIIMVTFVSMLQTEKATFKTISGSISNIFFLLE